MPDGFGRNQLANGILFNISWLAIVSLESTLAAIAVTALHLTLHAALFTRQYREWIFIAAVFLFGACLDQLTFMLRLFTLSGETGCAPIWLSCLWPVLATTFAHAFKGLQTHLLLAALLGGFGGVLSYTAGTRMTDVDFGHPIYSPILIAILWSLLFPALSRASKIVIEKGVTADAT